VLGCRSRAVFIILAVGGRAVALVASQSWVVAWIDFAMALPVVALALVLKLIQPPSLEVAFLRRANWSSLSADGRRISTPPP
jgi:hypothetical protein